MKGSAWVLGALAGMMLAGTALAETTTARNVNLIR